MSRRWHLAHADGREWTVEEMERAFDERYVYLALEMSGVVVGLSEDGWESVPMDDDMVVVWDG